MMAALPGQFTAGLDLDNWKLLLAWKAKTAAVQESLYHFHVRPFTSLVANNDTRPIVSNPHTKDVVARGASLQTVVVSLLSRANVSTR